MEEETITITLPKETIEKIDEIVKIRPKLVKSRSEFIKFAVNHYFEHVYRSWR